MDRIKHTITGAAVFLFFLYLCIYPYTSFLVFDVPFSILAEKIIVQQHGFLQHDIFLYTIPYYKPYDMPNEEYGYQVLVYLIHRFAGISGIIIFKCLLITSIFVVLSLINRKNKIPLLINPGILLLSYSAIRSRFMPRPYC
jgi:hypothetical protein